MPDPSPAAQLFAGLAEIAELANIHYQAVITQGRTEKEAFKDALMISQGRHAVWARYVNRIIP